MAGPVLLASMPFVPSDPVRGPIVVVPTAADVLADRDVIVDDLVTALRRTGEEVRVVEPATDGLDELGRAGSFAVGGGDPFHLLEVLRTTGADRAIARRVAGGVPYLGISAGAMVAGPSLAPLVGVSPFTPPPGLALDGLGLTSTLVLVHHDRPGRAAKHVAALAAHPGAPARVPLRDDERLVERDGSTRVGWPGGRWLRPATVADAGGVADVFGAAARTAWVSFLGDAVASFAPMGDEWAPRVDEVLECGGTFPVVEADGRIVAFAATRPPADDDLAGIDGLGELHLFYAAPAVWGTDTARRLHQRALWDLAAAGYRHAVLWTEDRNERALRFYQRTGWRPDGGQRRRTFLDVPIAESRHRIELGPAIGAEATG